MAKFDPIVSEFATEADARAHDEWFRAEVEAALAEKGKGIAHAEVMREGQAIIDKHRNVQKPDLAA